MTKRKLKFPHKYTWASIKNSYSKGASMVLYEYQDFHDTLLVGYGGKSMEGIREKDKIMLSEAQRRYNNGAHNKI